VHQAQLGTCLRLDTCLAKLVPDRAEFAQVMQALKTHAAEMLTEGDRLLKFHTARALEAETALEQASYTDAACASDVVCKTESMEALSSQAREVRKQIAEFTMARAAFMEADPGSSFAGARVFAREVYNRFRSCLPIYAERSKILEALQYDFGALVLSAETGSGKSTQVVQYLAETVKGAIVCSQPRRLAASTLADRVAEEMQTIKADKDGPNLVSCLGSRNDETRSRVKFCTDYALLNLLAKRPELDGIGAVVVDEVHERSIGTDLLVALLRRTLSLRATRGKQPFRLILTSATMNEALFAKYLARSSWDSASPLDTTWAPVMKVGGRTFPVSIHFDTVGSSVRYESAAETKAIELHALLPPSNHEQKAMNDILIFQTAPDECERVCKALSEQLKDALCVSLHGGLDKDEQRVAFEPIDVIRFKRKIVVP